MKVIILAGGLGTRLAEETSDKPKPMVEIHGNPILWHIMKSYESYIDCEFIIATGYLSEIIEEYLSSSRFMSEGIKAQALFTGADSSTGGRVRQAMASCPGERVMVTYGDGVSDINIKALLDFHGSHGKKATITAVQPPGRYGSLVLDRESVQGFIEKPRGDGGWINGGFFALSPDCLEYIEDDSTSWEGEPLVELASAGELMAFKHHGFWQPMDTLRDKNQLEALWQQGVAPWKTWD